MTTTQVNYIDTVKTFLHSGAAKQALSLAGISISVALGIVLYMTIQEPIYRPLDYQVNPQNMSAIIDTLDKAGVQYKVNDRDGVIYVSAKDLQLAKIKLSSAGIAKDDSMNYSFLNEPNNFGNSQFIENARYLRALESDLAKTINGIEGVSSTRVHIAVPQNSVFADETGKTTASVVLGINPGFANDKEKIRSIVQIIAGSVPGLDPKNVAITDQYGHVLSTGDQDATFNIEQMNYQNSLQTYYEKRIESMIVPLLGENKVSVRVSAKVDFTQQEEAIEQYDPDKKVIRSEQSMSESSDVSSASGAPGALSNSPPGDSDADKSRSSSSGGGNQGRNQSVKNYELSKSVNYKKSYAPKVVGLSVAVVIDNEMVTDPKTKQLVSKPLDQDKINKITQLVQATVGYDQARGDRVTVVNSGFSPVKQEMLIPTHIWDQAWFWDVVKKMSGMLAGFVFLIILYRRLSSGVRISHSIIKTKTKPKLEENPDAAANDDPASAGITEHTNNKKEQIKQLKQLASTEPQRVALVIKNWVGKS